MIAYLPSLEEFRRRRDAHALADLESRLPELARQYEAARAARAALAAAIARYGQRKERVPAALEDEYLSAAWAWQRAYAAYTLAQKTYEQLTREVQS